MYDLLGVSFDSYAGESFYNDKMGPSLTSCSEKGLLNRRLRALRSWIWRPTACRPALILRSDGATLYITRDLAAAILPQEHVSL